MSLPLVAVSAKEEKMENIDLTLELERTQVPGWVSPRHFSSIQNRKKCFCPEKFQFRKYVNDDTSGPTCKEGGRVGFSGRPAPWGRRALITL